MNEVKALAWDQENQTMKPHDYLCTDKMTLHEHCRAIADFWFMALSHEWPIFLSTGILDKNGKEIYDHHKIRFINVIVDSKLFSGETFVWFRHGCFVLDKVGSYSPIVRGSTVGLGFYTPTLYNINSKNLEIIGHTAIREPK